MDRRAALYQVVTANRQHQSLNTPSQYTGGWHPATGHVTPEAEVPQKKKYPSEAPGTMDEYDKATSAGPAKHIEPEPGNIKNLDPCGNPMLNNTDLDLLGCGQSAVPAAVPIGSGFNVSIVQTPESLEYYRTASYTPPNWANPWNSWNLG
jgi:hypothetical protein